jgi:hypothetical protein
MIMSELSEWEMVDLYEIPKFEKWMCVSPKGYDIHTGCGIIVDVEDVPEKRKGMLGDKLYTVLTDFGNTFKMTIYELESVYVATRKEDDPQARYIRQQELLKEAWGKWFNVPQSYDSDDK